MFTKHRFFCYLILTIGKYPVTISYVHMKKFEDGAAFIQTKNKYKFYPTIGNTEKFVSNPESIEKIVRDANGDLRKIEKSLGLKDGDLGDKTEEVYIIYIQPKQIKNARMPSGNEGGANRFWIPGGCTASENALGIPEIVIDCSGLPSESFHPDYNNRISLKDFYKNKEYYENNKLR